MAINIIKQYPAVPYGDDLMYCPQHGVAYQVDMSRSVEYGIDYFEKYVGYEDTAIARDLNAVRTALTAKYCQCVLDVGIGSGEFIKKSKIKTYGYDINVIAQDWLRMNAIYVNPYKYIPEDVEGFSFWDVLEHIPEPQEILAVIRSGQYIFVSIPIIKDLIYVRESKHYRPDEHYYYYTREGFINFMQESGFTKVEENNHETQVGRDEIMTFVFRKN